MPCLRQAICVALALGLVGSDASYVVVDTAQALCFGAMQPMTCPTSDAFYGQDAQYAHLAPSYTDNGDGTVTDDNTGLMWQQDPGSKVQYSAAIQAVDDAALAGYSDWRVPTVKELYSLILFSGRDISGVETTDTSSFIPFIDTSAFAFQYGDASAGERLIDSQWVTSTVYVSTVMNQQECFFGVNFADGRIKCYPTSPPPPGPQRRLQGGSLGYFAIYVRGPAYGVNDFAADGSVVSDRATGLMWMQADSGSALSWEAALAYCEDLDHASYTDWRLPNAHELHSIVDYTRSPDTTNSPAIDSVFSVSSITNEAGQTDYPCFWTSTTHANQGNFPGAYAAYIGFGRCLGKMNGQWIDVHGAGCQRSDPKTGDAGDYPDGHGPQGDAIRIINYVRCVRTESEPGDATSSTSEASESTATTSEVSDGEEVSVPLVTTSEESSDSETTEDTTTDEQAGDSTTSAEAESSSSETLEATTTTSVVVINTGSDGTGPLTSGASMALALLGAIALQVLGRLA